jgi:hypothetical protein
VISRTISLQSQNSDAFKMPPKVRRRGTSSRFAALSYAFQGFACREVFAAVGFGPVDILCLNRGRWVSLTMAHDEMHDPKEGPAKTEDRPS